MVWIGLHGVMFLFLFSDFYKTKYKSKRRSDDDDDKAKNGIVSNGITKPNGTTKTTNGFTNGFIKAYISNKGFCMVS